MAREQHVGDLCYTVSMADQKVVEYVKKAQAEGVSKELIYKQLLSEGTSIDAIQSAYLALMEDESKVDTSKKTIRLIVAIAIFLIGAGVFSFIAANWQGISSVGKVILILAAMLTSYGSGWYLKEQKNFLRTGNGLIVLGVIIYGAGIFLIAQIFHLKIDWPDGLILWMLGSIAMAYAADVFALFSLALPLGVMVSLSSPMSLMQPIRTGQSQFGSTFLMIIATIVLFDAGLRLRKRILTKVESI